MALEPELTPKEYFEQIKQKKETMTDSKLRQIHANCLELADKFIATGQAAAAKKLVFEIEAIEKEYDLLELGINTYIFNNDIEDFIQNVADKTVKIIELERYERDIPDNIVETIKTVKPLFNQLYVLFTDYTGEIERKVEKERRDRDPILFGVFMDTKNDALVNRFYFLGDWEDQYCDLTLSKMLSQMEQKTGKNIANKITISTDIQDLKKRVFGMKEVQDDLAKSHDMPLVKQSWFSSVKSFFKGLLHGSAH